MRRRRRNSLADVVALPLLIGGALAGAEIGRRLFRRTQLFCPSREPLISWDPADYGIPPGAVEEHWIDTPDGETLHAWYCRSETPKASAVFCHGNTGNLTTSADVIPHLLAAGFNVLFFDYRGFGRSSGRASFGGVVSDGITASRFHETIRPKHLRCILYGYSLGGAVAAQVIRRHPFDALILQSTFTNLRELARVAWQRLPVHLFAGTDVFETSDVIRRLQVPLLVLHGSDDPTCPCWMAHNLYDACKTMKRIHVVDGGVHKDLFIRDPESMVRAISQFIADLPPGTRTVSVEETPAIEQWTDSALRTVRKFVRKRVAQHA